MNAKAKAASSPRMNGSGPGHRAGLSLPAARNESCPCGSGRKFKKCCLGKQADAQSGPLPASIAVDLEQWIRAAEQLKGMGHHRQAESLYRQILAVDPAHPWALYNIGMMELRAGRPDLAYAPMQRALAAAPNVAEWHNDLGLVCVDLGRLDEAGRCFHRAIELAPHFSLAHFNFGAVLYTQQRFDEALQNYVRCLELDPENSAAAHFIALLQGRTADAAPARYVEELFDTYADSFEQHLIGCLSYRAHVEAVNLALKHLPPEPHRLRVLDLGCGTGLAGMSIHPRCSELVGIDLSRKMLQEAQEKGIYQRLVRGDLAEMIGLEESASYDLVLATDVFIYIGALEGVLRDVRRVLVPGGVFAFSVEALTALQDLSVEVADATGYRLQKNGRYAHAEAYVLEALTAAGFRTCEKVLTTARTEQERDVQAWTFICRATDVLRG